MNPISPGRILCSTKWIPVKFAWELLWGVRECCLLLGMLFLPGRINWKPAYAVWPWNTLGRPGALFCHVECLETRGTVAGRSLHGMCLVVVVFLGAFL